MKIAVVGSRTFHDYSLLRSTLDQIPIQEIISGGAPGADTLAEKYAHERKIPLIVIRPEWNKYGRSAGLRRNSEIVALADQIVAFWDGTSPGTYDTITKAQKMGKEVHIIRF